MASTPIKRSCVNQCIVCNASGSTRLYRFSNNKAIKSNCLQALKLLVGEDGPMVFDPEQLFACKTCLTFLDKVNVNRKRIIMNLENPSKTTEKRMATTPTSELKKRSVAEQLSLSVEKLNIQGADNNKQSKRIRRKINFENNWEGSEHPYAKSFSQLSGPSNDNNELLEEIKLSLFKKSNAIFNQMDADLVTLASASSVLYTKNGLHLAKNNILHDGVIELYEGCPLLFHCLKTALGDRITEASKLATVGTIYGMILHSRNSKVSAVQRLYSTVALRYNADNKLLSKLNNVHLTLTEDSKRNIIEGFGQESEEGLIQEISKGANGKFNGDNLDIRVATNDMRMNTKDRDYHFFATDFTLDRVKTNHLSNEERKVENVDVDAFILKETELLSLKENLKTLLGREMMKLDGFKWMESIVSKHILHPLTEEMSQQSKIFILPVSLNNEAKYADCIRILDESVMYLNQWYTKAGRVSDLEHLSVPFGGDQLTRVRLQGAKSLRAGAHTESERFDHLHPVIIEMFHTLQDFMEKLCKKFLKMDCGRDVGTLPNLKVLIQRANVNGNVKSRYKAHEDFVLTCGQSYFCSYLCHKFNMNDINDKPEHPAINSKIKSWNNQHKLKIFNKVMDEILSEIFIPFQYENSINREIIVQVTVDNQQTFEMTATVSAQGTVEMGLDIDGSMVNFSFLEDKLVQGSKVQVINPCVSILFKKIEKRDDLNNYVKKFLQWYFAVIQFKDAVKEGDIDRININLKHMIPFFYSHSSLSKYMTECIDYILKTEHILSPQLSLKVRAGSVVNPSGRLGKNKAADLQKENQVKFLKTLIRSLGANKTEKSIINITKAAPVLMDICSNFDNMTNDKSIKTSHKVKSRDVDVNAILNKLKKLDIWTVHPHRILAQKVAGTPFCFDKNHFTSTVKSTVQRLLMDFPIPLELSDDSEVEED